MDGRMRLDRDFSEFIGFLSAHEVRFLVVGGYAVAVEVQLDEVVVPFIGLDDLRRNKTVLPP